MADYKQLFWDKILPRVQKPTRYLGNEVNAITKDHHKCTVKVALAFPDLYEIGMSHLGLKILYHIVNQRSDWLAERVFMPDSDLENILRTEQFPLTSLETVTPLQFFDVVGFTLQYELSYATILQMLEMANIPLLARERLETDPLVAGGGPCAFNPEPLADFFDFFLIGDAEEALPEVLHELEKNRHLPRQEKLLKLTRIQGVYVPALYRAVFHQDESKAEKIYEQTIPIHPDIRPTVKRAVVADLDQAPYPTDFIVPYGGIVHDRLVLELFRGCTRGCRFCQAGIIYRPVRERKKETLKELALQMVKATGYEEMALSSLSTGDYSDIENLVNELGVDLARAGVSLSLPSLRLDSFSSELADEVQRLRKSGLTFAPEAGSQRLRNVINKNISDDDLLSAVREAFGAGWTSVKLYFMLGLPTETYEDLLGIAALAKQVLQVYRQAGGRGKPRISVSVSVFVPKAHTPFQWVGQISKEEILLRQQFLRQALKLPGVQFQWHGAETSLLEAAIARGGRELVPVILRAARLGCKLDGWDEHFRFDVWQQAFLENGLDLASLAQKEYPEDAVLPWDHLDSGVSKRFLIREYRRALRGEVTADCRQNCLGCGMTLLFADETDKGVCTRADLD